MKHLKLTIVSGAESTAREFSKFFHAPPPQEFNSISAAAVVKDE
jgi:hypothetical protein